MRRRRVLTILMYSGKRREKFEPQLAIRLSSALSRPQPQLASRTARVPDPTFATRPIPARVSDQLQSARVQLAVSTHPTIKAFPISSCPARVRSCSYCSSRFILLGGPVSTII
ncbi:hypothetical protein DY000_02046028 [Brassica cretica]|uniref:Uncharacterized protein n=1 Tax=Brassica cretica TaxID=69181 RepID=A0ABQ7EXM5_BRACR|nr:hypothetical protein DY000_02046028 [Brassica cretica]